MDDTLNSLYQTLERLVGLHRQMLESVRMEHDGLVRAEIKAIEDAAASKEALIALIKHEESARLKLTADLAIKWQRAMRELTLTEIIITVQGRDQRFSEKLRSAFNALTILIQRVREQNEANRLLVEKSLQHIGAMKMNVLGETVKKTDTYTQQGKKAVKTGASCLFSREA